MSALLTRSIMKKALLSLLLISGYTLQSQNITGTYITTQCKTYKHPEIQFNITDSSVDAADIQWLKNYLEQEVSQGRKFKNGKTYKIGWMTVKFVKNSNGNLELHEPNMVDIPIRYENKADHTLLHRHMQKEVVASLDPLVNVQFPEITETIVVHDNFMKASSIMLERTHSGDLHSSGWMVYDYEDEGSGDDTDFVKISLYEFALSRPDLVKFLALPEGMIVVKAFGGIQVYNQNNQQVNIRDGSFIDVLMKSEEQ